MEELREPNYQELLRQQALDQFNFMKARLEVAKGKVLMEQQGADIRVIPRYLARALESGSLNRVNLCVQKAMQDDGWTEEELDKAIDNLIEK